MPCNKILCPLPFPRKTWLTAIECTVRRARRRCHETNKAHAVDVSDPGGVRIRMDVTDDGGSNSIPFPPFSPPLPSCHCHHARSHSFPPLPGCLTSSKRTSRRLAHQKKVQNTRRVKRCRLAGRPAAAVTFSSSQGPARPAGGGQALKSNVAVSLNYSYSKIFTAPRTVAAGHLRHPITSPGDCSSFDQRAGL